MNGDKPRGEDREGQSASTRPAAATLGLGATSKILDLHWNRLAMVYVRQSTPQQVLEIGCQLTILGSNTSPIENA
jgi:hypothetical protein